MSDKPDYVYDPDDWEITYHWDDRSYLEDDQVGEFWQPREFQTLKKGPPVWAVEVVLTRDENGDPDETEIQWFFSFEEAQKAAKGNP